jgi:hypothetical protein
MAVMIGVGAAGVCTGLAATAAMARTIAMAALRRNNTNGKALLMIRWFNAVSRRTAAAPRDRKTGMDGPTAVCAAGSSFALGSNEADLSTENVP